jgi:hypothetical protein
MKKKKDSQSPDKNKSGTDLVGKIEFNFELRDLESQDALEADNAEPSTDFRAKDGVLAVQVKNLTDFPEPTEAQKKDGCAHAYGVSLALPPTAGLVGRYEASIQKDTGPAR